ADAAGGEREAEQVKRVQEWFGHGQLCSTLLVLMTMSLDLETSRFLPPISTLSGSSVITLSPQTSSILSSALIEISLPLASNARPAVHDALSVAASTYLPLVFCINRPPMAST